MTKEIYRHIKETLLYTKDSLSVHHPITEEMFEDTDILDIILLEDGAFYVTFHGINGTMPCVFFDKKARDKILKLHKRLNSKLWKVLNDDT